MRRAGWCGRRGAVIGWTKSPGRPGGGEAQAGAGTGEPRAADTHG